METKATVAAPALDENQVHEKALKASAGFNYVLTAEELEERKREYEAKQAPGAAPFNDSYWNKSLTEGAKLQYLSPYYTKKTPVGPVYVLIEEAFGKCLEELPYVGLFLGLLYTHLQPSVWDVMTQEISQKLVKGLTDAVDLYSKIKDPAFRLSQAGAISVVMTTIWPFINDLQWRDIEVYYTFAIMHVALCKDLAIMLPNEEAVQKKLLEVVSAHALKLQSYYPSIVNAACTQGVGEGRICHNHSSNLYCNLKKGGFRDIKTDAGFGCSVSWISERCDNFCTDFCDQLRSKSVETLKGAFEDKLRDIANAK